MPRRPAARLPRVAAASAPPVYTVVPFIGMLLGIALVPLAAPEWWRHNRNTRPGPGAHSDEVVGMPHAVLAALSAGAVAMGANSYIGNAPNFMVKAIAEEAGVRMPGFFGHMAYSAVVLVPLFVVVTVIFF